MSGPDHRIATNPRPNTSEANPRAVPDAIDEIRAAAAATRRVAGQTHEYYRYPARFSPQFARSAIQSFTKAGDVVLDPFMGGGTSAVEALSLRRRYIGADISPISTFVTRIKTTPLSVQDASVILGWAAATRDYSNPESHASGAAARIEFGPNVPWWLSREIGRLAHSAALLPTRVQRAFARCTVLRVAQWALDNRRQIARLEEFREAHQKFVAGMLSYAVRMGQDAGPIHPPSDWSSRRLLCRPAAGLEHDRRIPQSWKPVRLVVTSPPYPGVHVLYHRWQVQGRRETAAPFWIVGREDGHPSSHYTMGPRYAPDLSGYLVEFESSFRSVAAMLDRHSLVVQLVGFSDAETQLGPVLDAMVSAGFSEVDADNPRMGSSRLWRSVPNRRWYALNQPSADASREVLLLHRLSR